MGGEVIADGDGKTLTGPVSPCMAEHVPEHDFAAASPTTSVEAVISASSSWSIDAVLAELPTPHPEGNSASPMPFFHVLSRLKTTKRAGWQRHGIPDGESVSDHMYRMSIITMLAPPALQKTLDIPRCTKMALVHDMAEALVGDITPVDNVPKQEKSRRESLTMDYFTKSLLGNVDGGAQGKDLRAVWEEYEESKTREAKFVHDVDKIELLLQMLEYEKARGGSLDLGEFAWVAEKLELPEMRQWSDEIRQEREAYWTSIGKVANKAGSLSWDMRQKQDDYYDREGGHA
ncbi:MAG: hypothetical protein M1833_004089 [Piccolia ochrophora]|nr:MAG: hypothetical protein M1833_004089 [Piccolia ochrophora]